MHQRLAERKLQRGERTAASRAVQLVKKALEQRQARQCRWSGFTHKGAPAVCVNESLLARTAGRVAIQVCGYHVTKCILTPSMAGAKAPHASRHSQKCPRLLREAANVHGLCLNHHRSKFSTLPPPVDPRRLPGVHSRAWYQRQCRQLLQQAAVSHPLAPPVEGEVAPGDGDEDAGDSDGVAVPKQVRFAAGPGPPRKVHGAWSDTGSTYTQDDLSLAVANCGTAMRAGAKALFVSPVRTVAFKTRVRLRGRIAAARIQAAVRQWLAARRAATVYRTVQLDRRTRAATALSAWWRGVLGRKTATLYRQSMCTAVATVERAWRHYTANIRLWRRIQRSVKVACWGY